MPPKKSKTLLFHLALVAAGWGIVAAVPVRFLTGSSSSSANSVAAPTKLPRPELDHPGGQRILDRLARKLEPPALPGPDSWTSLTLEEKTDLRIRQDEDRERRPLSAAHREQFRKNAILRDLDLIVGGAQGPDLAYAFRHGRIEAREIFDQLAARIPEHAATPGFAALLYEVLAAEDPRRADALLDSLPEAEKLQQKDRLFSNLELTEDPDAAYAFLSTIPWRDDPDGLAARRRKWEDCAELNTSRHFDDYLAWVQALPRGRDRDLAISSMIEHVSGRNPDDTARVRALIDDPVIRGSR